MTLSPSSSDPITPPATPIGNQSQSSHTHTSIYPSPTNSTSRSSSSASLKPSFSIRENVQVMVRCRPRSKKELEIDEEPCWLIRPEDGTIELARLKAPKTIQGFQFDNVLMGMDNSQVHKAGIRDLVRSAMMGYNGTVFAYGQTASGKTYVNDGTEKEPGVIPRAVQDVFSFIEEETSGREYLLRVSYMEIYNEKIKDLLNTENKNPEIIEDKKGIYVRNLREVIVKTPQEVMDCIKEGEGNRHISATDYNEHSSRSHTIFQLVIESKSKGGMIPAGANRGVRVSQLNLIDLAGSEKVATDVERRKEGAFINKSLLTLGNVISKLTSDEPAVHIPFRNSKLTRILQAALSGNARISVICTINPTLASKNESLNTLRFAQRAKLVKTAAKMTRILDNSELQNCLIRIAELQTKMQEKNDLEAETRERLKSLLGLILTSSKATGDDDHIHNDEMFSRLSNLSQDTLVNETTMRDVVARCEEGFAAQIEAHQRQMEKMAMNIESMQDTLRVMESVNAKQNETLSKREAHIEKLKQELAASTAAAAAQASSLRASKVPTTSLSSKQKIIDDLEVKKAQQIKDEQEAIEALKQEKTEALVRAQDMAELLKKEKAEALRREQDMAEALKQEQKRIEILRQERNEILKKEQQQINEAMRKDQEEQELKMADLTVAISSAAQMITDAISNGMQISVEEDYDMMTTSSVSSAEDVNQAITHTIENVIAASLSTKSTVDTTAITSAIQSAIQSSILSSSMSTHSTSASTPEFTTIQEAISFIQSDPIQLYESFCIVDQDDDVPELILQNSLQKSQHWTTEQCQNFEIKPIRQDIPYTDRAIVNHDSMTTQDDIYKPYSVSIEQPSVFGFLLNRWTFLFAVVYFFSQYF